VPLSGWHWSIATCLTPRTGTSGSSGQPAGPTKLRQCPMPMHHMHPLHSWIPWLIIYYPAQRCSIYLTLRSLWSWSVSNVLPGAGFLTTTREYVRSTFYWGYPCSSVRMLFSLQSKLNWSDFVILRDSLYGITNVQVFIYFQTNRDRGVSLYKLAVRPSYFLVSQCLTFHQVIWLW